MQQRASRCTSGEETEAQSGISLAQATCPVCGQVGMESRPASSGAFALEASWPVPARSLPSLTLAPSGPAPSAATC